MREAAVLFTRPGSVTLDTSAMPGDLVVRWLDIARRTWLSAQRFPQADRLPLQTPGEGMWAAVVQAGN